MTPNIWPEEQGLKSLSPKGEGLKPKEGTIKDKNDSPTIGILLCQSSNKLIVEYCLKDIGKPIGVSDYTTAKLPKNMAKYLPTQEQFQHIMDITCTT